VFLGEQVGGVVDSRMVFEINFPMLDCFAYCIFSGIEVAKIFDGCGLGTIYATLVVIEDRRWCVCAMHFKVS
jgi:hypothetical protein